MEHRNLVAVLVLETTQETIVNPFVQMVLMVTHAKTMAKQLATQAFVTAYV